MASRRIRNLFLSAGALLAVGGAAFAGGLLGPGETVVQPAVAESSTVDAAPPWAGEAAAMPAPSTATGPVEEAAPADDELRILVSLKARRLWLVDGQDTLLRAPVAIGMGKDFSYAGRKYHFATPRGRRTVIGKAKDPLWIVPEWHYFERAAKWDLEVVKLEKDARIQLSDSSFLVVRGDQVGRINHFDNFAPFTPGTEIIYDGKIYVPPFNTSQRRVPNALGPYKLDMGDGYLIHGTHLYNEETIGEAVSHGCVRLRNEDLIRLYPLVPRGTPVILF